MMIMTACCQGAPQHIPPDPLGVGAPGLGHQPGPLLPGAPLPGPEPGQAQAQARGRMVSRIVYLSDMTLCELSVISV